MHRSILMLSFAFAALISVGAAAADFGLTVEVNQARRVMLRGIAANVLVTDPTVADVRMIDTHSVVVLGRGDGVTQILVTDNNGRTLMNARVAVVSPDQGGRVTVYRGPTSPQGSSSAIVYSCFGPCQALSVAAGGAPVVATAGPESGAPPAASSAASTAMARP